MLHGVSDINWTTNNLLDSEGLFKSANKQTDTIQEHEGEEEDPFDSLVEEEKKAP